MATFPSNLIMVKKIRGKGRGVFAKEFIAADTVFERVPVLVIPTKDVEPDETRTYLSDYVFHWGRGTVALALGYGSLYNHSYEPNARYDDLNPQTKIFTALRDIHPGEEITVNYNGEPQDNSELWFDAI